MTTLQAAIERAIRLIETERPAPVMATDEQVAAKIDDIATLGYIPSEQIIEPLRAYLSGFGLLLTGPAGAGKTFLMKCLGVRIYNADDVVDYGLSQMYKWYEYTDGGAEICIDDIGAERTVSEYGNKDDIMKSVLAHRSDKQTGVTHITTNMDADGIAQRYGDRTLSRLLGMCKAFALEGASKRAPKQDADTARHIREARARDWREDEGGEA